MPPRRAPQCRLVRRRSKDFFLQAVLAHEARHKRQTVRALCVDSMLEAALSGPLSHAAREIDLAPADLPAFVSKLDDDAHRPFAYDAPLAFGHVRDLLCAPVNERGDRACAERVADAEDVAPERRLLMIDVFGRAEHFEVESGPALAPEVNRVAAVEVDAPGGGLRLPAKPVELQCELGVRARRVVRA